MSSKNGFAASTPQILADLQKQARLSMSSTKNSEGLNLPPYLLPQPLKHLYGILCASERVFWYVKRKGK